MSYNISGIHRKGKGVKEKEGVEGETLVSPQN
jgi:hypothetical protein